MIGYLFVGGPRHGEFIGVRMDGIRLPSLVMVPLAVPVTLWSGGGSDPATYEGPRIAEYERKAIVDVTVYVFRGTNR